MLRTARLDLVPATAAPLTAARDDDRHTLGKLLDAAIPASWPPEHLDAAALQFTIDIVSRPDADPAWHFYWILLRDGAAGRTLIGAAGYKGPPSDGTVEVGYGIVADCQRRGYATEATQALVDHAFHAPGVARVIAETLPDLVPSLGVLQKVGFRFIGDGSEPGVIRYEVTR